MTNLFNDYILIMIIVLLLIFLFGKYNVIINLTNENERLYKKQYQLENEVVILRENEYELYQLQEKNKKLLEQVNSYKYLNVEFNQLKQENLDLKSKKYTAEYDISIFSRVNIRNTYTIVLDSNIVDTNEIHYIAFVNILLYVDSLKFYNMYKNEIYIDDKYYIQEYKLDQFIFQLTKNLLFYGNIEIIMAGILSLLGFSYELKVIKKSKKSGYVLSKIIANELLHLHYNDEKTIDEIIKIMNYLGNELKNKDMNTVIDLTASTLESEMILLEELEKVVITQDSFTPKSVCNTAISVIQK